jgi:hypothetical protein
VGDDPVRQGGGGSSGGTFNHGAQMKGWIGGLGGALEGGLDGG